MNLIIDNGNTRTKLGVFDKDQLLDTFIWQKEWGLKELRQLLDDFPILHIALSSTGKVPKQVATFLNTLPNYLELTADTPLPIQNLYKSPKTLGKDRIAAVVGAQQLYPAKSCLVIDAGTCITYDIIDHRAVYHGGNISPGIAMRLKAMHQLTARLPLVEAMPDSFELVGKTTETAIRNGAQTAAVLEVEGFIRHFKRHFGKFKVILTGGDATYFANHLKTKIFVHPNLVLVGLNKILNYNVQNLT